MPRNRTDYQVRMIMKQNRDGSPDRQKFRHRNLMLCVRQLQGRGYATRWDVHRLGRREVQRLVHDWQKAGLNHRTIANRMVDIRWLAGKLGREHLIPSNSELRISLRKNIPGWGRDRSRELDHARLQRLDQRAQLVTRAAPRVWTPRPGGDEVPARACHPCARRGLPRGVLVQGGPGPGDPGHDGPAARSPRSRRPVPGIAAGQRGMGTGP